MHVMAHFLTALLPISFLYSRTMPDETVRSLPAASLTQACTSLLSSPAASAQRPAGFFGGQCPAASASSPSRASASFFFAPATFVAGLQSLTAGARLKAQKASEPVRFIDFQTEEY